LFEYCVIGGNCKSVIRQ